MPWCDEKNSRNLWRCQLTEEGMPGLLGAWIQKTAAMELYLVGSDIMDWMGRAWNRTTGSLVGLSFYFGVFP